MAIRDWLPEKWMSGDKPHPVSFIQDEINKVFDGFFKGFDMDAPRAFTRQFRPAISISDSDKELVLTAEMPGMDENDVEVSLHDNILEIKGEKKTEHEEKDKNFYAMERSYGSFQRAIALPSEVDSERAKASFEKGILKVTLPKNAIETKKKLLLGKEKDKKDKK